MLSIRQSRHVRLRRLLRLLGNLGFYATDRIILAQRISLANSRNTQIDQGEQKKRN